MSDDEREAPQRRVYMLPPELVSRIVAFQVAKKLPSEVEAVRRLLDEALMHRDGPRDIVERMIQRTKETRIPSDAARDVLVGHPNVESITFQGEMVQFSLKTGEHYRIKPDGSAFEKSGYNDSWAPFDEIPF